MRTYGTPFVTKLEIAYGHHVSELRREKKRKEELYSLALALFLTLALYTTCPLATPVDQYTILSNV